MSKMKFLMLATVFTMLFGFNAYADGEINDIATVTKYANKEGANIYSAPADDAEVIDTTLLNTSFEVVYGGECDNWSQIVADDGFAFIKTEDLSDTETPKGHWVSLGKYKTTGYCNCRKCCGKWAGGKTASGAYPTAGRTVACGSLPFGTEILIEGMGQYTVEDRGVTGKHIDVYYGSHGTAWNHGVKYREVFKWVAE